MRLFLLAKYYQIGNSDLKGNNMQRRLHALGRLKAGTMNKTETAYARHLEMRKQAGEIVWYRFEGIKLRLADSCFITVDFSVMFATGQLEMHDVKGSKRIFSDDARVKMKVAADAYPFVFKAVYPKPKAAGWDVEEF